MKTVLYNNYPCFTSLNTLPKDQQAIKSIRESFSAFQAVNIRIQSCKHRARAFTEGTVPLVAFSFRYTRVFNRVSLCYSQPMHFLWSSLKQTKTSTESQKFRSKHHEMSKCHCVSKNSIVQYVLETKLQRQEE